MYKSADGTWEHDFRVAGVPRYRLSYGKVRKGEAERLHATAVAVFKSREVSVIESMRAGIVNIEQLAQLRERGLPFTAALLSSVPAAVADEQPWPTLAEAVQLYVAGLDQNQNKSDGTTRQALTSLRTALLYFDPTLRLNELTTKMVNSYQAHLKAEGYAQNTITAYVWRVGTMIRWFIKQEATDARETNRVVRVLHVPIDSEVISNKKTHRTRYLQPDEAAQLLAVTPRPYRFAVAAGLYAGLRIDEMCHLRPGADLDLRLGKLRVQEQPNWKPKTAKSTRWVNIGSALRVILDEQLAHFSSDQWVTPSFRNPALPLNRHSFDLWFGKIVAEAQLIPGRTHGDGVTYHTLRHTFASHLLINGADLFTVSQLLGNSVKQVETTYGHLSHDHRQVAVDRLSGIFGNLHSES